MAGTKHFSRMNFHVKRGMRELLSHRTLSKTEWLRIREYFENRCAFCGCDDTGNPRTGIVPDHLIPAVEYGESCVGNIVPACQDCNDHRGKKEWRQYLMNEFTDNAEERIRKIDAYLSEFPYVVSEDPHQYLNDNESEEYNAILNEWERVWSRARELRDRLAGRRRREQT